MSENKTRRSPLTIRRQYFNIPLYITAYVMALTCIMILTLRGPHESNKVAFLRELGFAMTVLVPTLIGPWAILSFINRRCFGRKIAVLDEDGIHVDGRFVPWRLVTRIEYDPSLPSKHTLMRHIPNAAVLVLKSGEVRIEMAPYYLLRAARFYAPHIQTGLCTMGKVLLGILFGLLAATAPVCFLFG